MALLSEAFAVGILLMILFGSAAFYLYTRITYNEKRLSMMEGLLVDIKMMIESSEQGSESAPVMPLASVYNYTLTPEEGTPLQEDESVYAEALEQAQEDLSGAMTEEEEAPAKVGPNYDAMTRAELATLAEQRNLRVTKRTGRGEIISLLRKSDGTNNGAGETGKENAGALFPSDGPLGGDLSLDSGNAGASLDA